MFGDSLDYFRAIPKELLVTSFITVFFANSRMEFLGGGFIHIFHVHPELWGRWTQLDGRIFFRWVGEKPPSRFWVPRTRLPRRALSLSWQTLLENAQRVLRFWENPTSGNTRNTLDRTFTSPKKLAWNSKKWWFLDVSPFSKQVFSGSMLAFLWV